jgi:hypothetical protein
MGCLERRIRVLEDLYHAGEARERTGRDEVREWKLRETLRSARRRGLLIVHGAATPQNPKSPRIVTRPPCKASL